MYKYIRTSWYKYYKPFKNYLKEKYIRYCIDKNATFSKVGKDDIISNWVGDDWYDDKIISKDLINIIFKECGLINKLDDS